MIETKNEFLEITSIHSKKFHNIKSNIYSIIYSIHFNSPYKVTIDFYT